jgi:hypothetical protein
VVKHLVFGLIEGNKPMKLRIYPIELMSGNKYAEWQTVTQTPLPTTRVLYKSSNTLGHAM